MNKFDLQRIKDRRLRERLEGLGETFQEPESRTIKTPSAGSAATPAPTPANDNAAFFVAGMSDFMRAMPNHIARSSLFAPVARGRRRYYQKPTEIVTRGDVKILYAGEQLDEADADLCLQLISLAKGTPLGEPVFYNRAQLLKALGRANGKHDYEWLERRLFALKHTALEIKTDNYEIGVKGKGGVFGILSSFWNDEDTGAHYFRLDAEWHKLFANREYALIDWAKRLEISRGQDMAKALQRLIATSADPVQRYRLDWLKKKMQYAGRLRDFKNALLRATAELERVEIIAGGDIERSTKGNDQLVIKL